VKSEPVLSSASVTATLVAVFNVLVVTNILVLTPEQVAAVNVAIGSVVSLMLAAWARGKVSPT
jgi:hypothetical protein